MELDFMERKDYFGFSFVCAKKISTIPNFTFNLLFIIFVHAKCCRFDFVWPMKRRMVFFFIPWLHLECSRTLFPTVTAAEGVSYWISIRHCRPSFHLVRRSSAVVVGKFRLFLCLFRRILFSYLPLLNF